jgi:hypothetical protein
MVNRWLTAPPEAQKPVFYQTVEHYPEKGAGTYFYRRKDCLL